MSKTQQSVSMDKMNSSKGLLRFLDMIERIGNKLPDPFMLFVYLALFIVALSAIVSTLGVTVVHPGSGEELPIKNLLSKEGIVYILTSMLTNFTEFKPLGLVLAMMLGIGLAEKVGLLETAMKRTIVNAPKAFITYAVVFVGILGNLASDAAFVIVPPLAATVFYTVGRHPLAGLAAGFAGVGAGFTANLLVTGTDALLAGISTEAAKSIDPNAVVTPVSNWYFMGVSVLFLSVLAALITEKIVEPKLGNYTGKATTAMDQATPLQVKGLRNAAFTAIGYVALLLLAIFIPGSPLVNEEGGLIPSPFLDGIIPIILFFFIAVGVAYGVTVKEIKSTRDIPRYMAEAIKDMSGYIVLIFAAAQFISYFNWSNLGTWVAVEGAEFLKSIHLTGLGALIAFSLLAALLNLLIFSGSAQWALMAPIFIPMFMLLGYKPELVQAAFRIADSSTNVITPLNPYMVVILAFMKEYDKKAGFGTLVSMMLPYSLVFLGFWIVLLVVFILFGIPLGPGVSM